jgi:pimeloyl-ACP methyl ester carboxylesterase
LSASPSSRRLGRHARRLALIVVAGAVALSIAVWQNGTASIARGALAEQPLPSGLAVEAVVLRETGKPALSGWLSAREAGCATVLLLHGRGSNKGAMAQRARLLADSGFSVALFDLRGHGGSEGDVRGFGYAEGEDVDRMLAYLRARFPGQAIGAVGSSLGAASLLFADLDQAADAYVLEQLYSTLDQTAALRAPLPLARDLQARVLLAQMPLRLGYSAADVRPVDRIGRLRRPILLLAAAADPYVGTDQTEALKDAAGADARLVWFEGAGHVDLQRQDPALYARSVVPFLIEALCTRRGRAAPQP